MSAPVFLNAFKSPPVPHPPTCGRASVTGPLRSPSCTGARARSSQAPPDGSASRTGGRRRPAARPDHRSPGRPAPVFVFVGRRGPGRAGAYLKAVTGAFSWAGPASHLARAGRRGTSGARRHTPRVPRGRGPVRGAADGRFVVSISSSAAPRSAAVKVRGSRSRDGIHHLLDVETARATVDTLATLNADPNEVSASPDLRPTARSTQPQPQRSSSVP